MAIADPVVDSCNMHSMLASKIAADQFVTQFHLYTPKGIPV